MKVGIVGCGLIGQKRANALGEHQLVAVADVDLARAEKLAQQKPNTVAFADWRKLIDHSDIDCVVVATSHNHLPTIALAAVEAGKHILLEKPAARNSKELEPVMAAVERRKVVAHVGFNHRYHPAFQQAREIFLSGVMGPLMFIRARYGHGGRIGYDREWRADPAVSGGGELLDQGVHLIDLSRWFLGDFVRAEGFTPTYFWDMPVEDNAFLMLRTEREQVAWLHATWTEWKNTFSFEIYGQTGKLQIDGLGGSYGVERLTYYQMSPELGPPATTAWEYPGEDRSWHREFEAFIGAVEGKREAETTLRDAHAALEIVGKVYAENRA